MFYRVMPISWQGSDPAPALPSRIRQRYHSWMSIPDRDTGKAVTIDVIIFDESAGTVRYPYALLFSVMNMVPSDPRQSITLNRNAGNMLARYVTILKPQVTLGHLYAGTIFLPGTICPSETTDSQICNSCDLAFGRLKGDDIIIR